ncbi:ABC transporter substrate-binding protein [Motiliproteus sp. MSK22-1]|uniref:substrate-binding periplasmic protein n=1 Tax=Motiliproteus sp. MSK22-1 TaxID=1897630 RepID=UPI0009758678|nr:transporter substrate-binding domain-containing protein [Motiliproteus sp. MSK22-1]OMH27548.1 hypothetical protein BGP75_22515 [Motiliproteus sp. MSK22-1]
MNSRILLILLLILSGSLCAEEVQVYTHSTEGAIYRDGDGKVKGKRGGGRRAFLIELVRSIMDSVGHRQNIKEVPLARGIKLLDNQRLTALFNLSKTEARKSKYKWVGPIQEDTVYFFENRKFPAGIETISDARAVKAICVRRGNSQIDNMIENGFSNLVYSNSYSGCWGMLSSGRVNLMTLGSNLVPSISIDHNGSHSVQNTGVVLQKSVGYIAFSKDTSDRLIQQWQEALDGMKTSGRYRELVQEYFCPRSC